MFVILEKARPYTRIRRGKLEHVRGYPSRPAQPKIDLKEFLSRYNLRSIDVKGKNVDKVIMIIDRELSKWRDKFKFDGRGELEFRVKRLFASGEILRGQYLVTVSRGQVVSRVLEIDDRYVESIIHEYAHFVYDFNEWNIRYIASIFSILDKNHIEKGFDHLINVIKLSPNKGTYEIVELFSKLKEFYASDEFIDKTNRLYVDVKKMLLERYPNVSENLIEKEVEKTKKRLLSYLFEPTEIFARAFESYVTNTVPISSNIIVKISGEKIVLGNLEDDPKYKQIVKEWGDKYLKTGIIKSFLRW